MGGCWTLSYPDLQQAKKARDDLKKKKKKKTKEEEEKEEEALEEDRIFWENWHEKNDCLNL